MWPRECRVSAAYAHKEVLQEDLRILYEPCGEGILRHIRVDEFRGGPICGCIGPIDRYLLIRTTRYGNSCPMCICCLVVLDQAIQQRLGIWIRHGGNGGFSLSLVRELEAAVRIPCHGSARFGASLSGSLYSLADSHVIRSCVTIACTMTSSHAREERGCLQCHTGDKGAVEVERKYLR